MASLHHTAEGLGAGPHPPALQVEGEEQGGGGAGWTPLARERLRIPHPSAQLVVVVDQQRGAVCAHLSQHSDLVGRLVCETYGSCRCLSAGHDLW